MKTAFEVFLICYTVGSPFLFLWFHRNVLKEDWDGDLADRVTIRLYIISNIAAQSLAYFLEECGKGCS